MDKNILLIGGLDPSGCAGIAADLKTCMAWGTYGLPVITAIAAQNTREVTGVYPVSEQAIISQVETVVSDIEIHAVKIGLLGHVSTLELIDSLCRKFHFTNIVVDPVLRSTTGYDFADSQLITQYKQKLFSIADVITPNIYEASLLSGIEVSGIESMKEAATRLFESGARNIVITGGHLDMAAIDVWFDGSEHHTFEARKITNTNGRGLGCTFAAILAGHLARGQNLSVAITVAKQYIAKALVHPFRIGKGRGPLNHKISTAGF